MTPEEIQEFEKEQRARILRVTGMFAKMRAHIRLQPTDEITPLSLDRAISHPILGGTLRRNPAHDIPGPTYTENSLRRAATKGELKCVWDGRLQRVTPLALREWISRERIIAKSEIQGFEKSSLSVTARTLHEKREGSASVALALAALDSITVKPGQTLKPKKRGR